MEKMNILCATNDRYVSPCLTMLQSLFENCDHEIVVWYLYDNLSDRNKKRIKKLVESKNKGILQLVKVEDEIFLEAPVINYFSKEMYYRILAAKLLPNTLERVLYLDADIIIKDNIDEFYYQDFTINDIENLFIVCPDQIDDYHNQEYHNRLKIPMEKAYFNSGVMLMNLEMMRQEVKLPQVFDYISNNREKLRLPDQDLLNALYYDKVMVVDKKYNLMLGSYSSTSFEKINDAKIIHFTGGSKPWKYGYCKMGGEMFKEYTIKAGCGIWYKKSKMTSWVLTRIKALTKFLKK
ncbi:MAG: glycosyltransferase family 8 protein [Ruminococcus sp.]|nr:glycosyltransferase family 8 protein [Ruminococcus sp.]